MQGQWADGDHLPGTLQGQYTPDQLQLLCLSQVPQSPHVLKSRSLPSQHDLPCYEHAHVPSRQRRAGYRFLCVRCQDSDELWTLSPPARRSLETLLRNSSDASVRTLGRSNTTNRRS